MTGDASVDTTRKQVESTLSGFMRLLDTRDSDAVRALVTDDFVAIDAFPPHAWNGTGAVDVWLRDLWRYCDALGVTMCQTTVRHASRVTVEGDAAYIAAPATMASSLDGDLISQAGVLTASMRREEGRWRVAAFCWAGQ